MQKLVVVSEDLVLLGNADGQVAYLTLEEAKAHLARSKKPVLAAVVPVQAAALMGSEQTVEESAAAQFPGEHSLRTEELATNSFQVFAIQDALFAKVRALSKKVDVVPYSAAVRAAVQKRGERAKTGMRKLTQVFTKTEDLATDPLQDPDAPPEVVVVDALKEDYLVTAFRGKEVVAVRRVRGGNPIDEIQRTTAAARLSAPRIICTDREVAVELQAHGFQSETVTTEVGLLGWTTLEAALPLRFLNAKEIAQERMQRNRTVALAFVAVSVVVFLLAGGVFFVGTVKSVQANSETSGLEIQKAKLTAEVSKLYIERYSTKAHADSVKLDNELLDLVLSVPPQVNIIAFEKTKDEVTAELERRAGAAPFGRDDLKGLLMVSPFFAGAQITEEFGGHTVKYTVKVKLDGRGSVVAAGGTP